jgi:HD-like signal output (HDOD) protein
VVILGYDVVKNLALGVGAFEVLSKQLKDGPLDYGEFWQHSLAAAGAGRLLAERSGYTPVEEGFVAGLLHDAGKLFLGISAPKVLEIILQEAAEQPGRDLAEIENELLGIDHCVLGANIFKHWNFPEPLLWAVRRHHSAETDNDGGAPRLEAITYLADALARIRCAGSGGNDAFPSIPQQFMERLKIDESGLLGILLEMDAEIEKAASLLHIELPKNRGNLKNGAAERCEKILLVGATPRQTRPQRLALESAGYHVTVKIARELKCADVAEAEPEILVIDATDPSFDVESLSGKTLLRRPVVVIAANGKAGAIPAGENVSLLAAPITVMGLLDSVCSLKVKSCV